MPTYNYECEECGFEFEKFQGIKEEKIKQCPKCQGKVRRIITGGSGVIFKGSGFYVTDYKKKETGSKKAAEKVESTSESTNKHDCKNCPHKTSGDK